MTRRFPEPDLRSFAPPLLLLLLCSAAQGACVQYQRAPHWIGGAALPLQAGDLKVAGNLAYVATYAARASDHTGGLQIVDVSDPAELRLKGSVTLQNRRPQALGIVGPIAALACIENALAVVDVSSPDVLIRRFEISLPGEGRGVALRDSVAFVSMGRAGLGIYRLSAVAAPVALGRLQTPGYLWSVVLNGNLAYAAADTAGLLVIDISDPAAPSLVTRLDPSKTESPPAVRSLSLASGRLFVLADRLLEYSLAYPREPELVADLSLPFWGTTLCAGEGVVCMGETPARIDFAQVASSGSMSNLGTVIPSDLPVRMVLDGTRIFAACLSAGVQIFDFDELATTEPIGSFGVSALARGIATRGRLACVAAGNGLEITDLTDPASPANIGWIDGLGTALGVDWSGRYAYVAGDSSGLEVVDMADPRTPSLAARLVLPGQAKAVRVAGSLALVAAADSGLQIIDVADPEHPVRLAGVGLPGSAVAVGRADTLAFIAAGLGGFHVVDIRDPRYPVLLSTFPIQDSNLVDLAIAGQYAYLASEKDGLFVLRVANPELPSFVGRLRAPADVRRIIVAGSYAYLATGKTGTQIVDVTDPANPATAGVAVANARMIGLAGEMLCAGGATFSVLPAQCGGEAPGGIYGLTAQESAGAIRIDWRMDPKSPYIGFAIERSFGPHPEQTGYRVLNSFDRIPAEGPFEYVDHDVVLGTAFSYRVEAILADGSSDCYGPVAVTTLGEPDFAILAPAPNPSRGSALIRFALPAPGRAKLQIFDASGRSVRVLRDGEFSSGLQEITWSGRDDLGRPAGSGVYFLRLAGEGRTATGRLIYMQ
jgi:hypothetical protein